ncbi:hypothetical protein HDU82_000628 [Entophlyctis luteolus]|nr:hypothetical protein HDU82_000628 [Entophlyctis luteolus]
MSLSESPDEEVAAVEAPEPLDTTDTTTMETAELLEFCAIALGADARNTNVDWAGRAAGTLSALALADTCPREIWGYCAVRAVCAVSAACRSPYAWDLLAMGYFRTRDVQRQPKLVRSVVSWAALEPIPGVEMEDPLPAVAADDAADTGAVPTDEDALAATSVFSEAHAEPPAKKTAHFGPYLLIRTIGEGQFGKAKLALDSRTNEEFAIKFLKKERVKTGEERRRILREITTLQMLDHPYVVSLKEVVETDTYIGLVLQYAPGGELFHYVMAQPNGHVEEAEGRKFFAQIISGRENILLGPNNTVLISDLGFANRNSDHMETQVSPVTRGKIVTSELPHIVFSSEIQCGSPNYAAPELVKSGDYSGYSADIWSCGVILYAMLCGYLPYDDDLDNVDVDNVTSLYQHICTAILTYPRWITPLARSLIGKIIVPDPKYRAKMSEIMGHEFSNVNLWALFGYIEDANRRAPTKEVRKAIPSFASTPRQSVSALRPNWMWGAKVPPSKAQVTRVHRPVNAMDSTSVRTSSVSYSVAPSEFTSGTSVLTLDQQRRMHIHQGIVDRRALSSRDPTELIGDLTALFAGKLGWAVETGSGAVNKSVSNFKFTVVKPQGGRLDELLADGISSENHEEVASNPVVLSVEHVGNGSPTSMLATPVTTSRSASFAFGSISLSSDSRISRIYSSFPLTFRTRLRSLMQTFVRTGSRGFDGRETAAGLELGGKRLEEALTFTVEVQRVEGMLGMYVVEFRRVRGDMWAFKRLYSDIIGILPL